jgi:hypothetical protein
VKKQTSGRCEGVPLSMDECQNLPQSYGTYKGEKNSAKLPSGCHRTGNFFSGLKIYYNSVTGSECSTAKPCLCRDGKDVVVAPTPSGEDIGVFKNWGWCSKPCGGGQQSRMKMCGSMLCPGAGSVQTRPCNTQPCGATKCPVFTIGDGHNAGPEMRIGDHTGEDCVNACIDRRETDPTINGVTVRNDGSTGCFCEKKMAYVLTDSRFKTCYLDPEDADRDSVKDRSPEVTTIWNSRCKDYDYQSLTREQCETYAKKLNKPFVSRDSSDHATECINRSSDVLYNTQSNKNQKCGGASGSPCVCNKQRAGSQRLIRALDSHLKHLRNRK